MCLVVLLLSKFRHCVVERPARPNTTTHQHLSLVKRVVTVVERRVF